METTTVSLSKTKDLFYSPEIHAKFKEILGKKSAAFVSSVLQIVSLSDKLKNAESKSILNAALTAATLDLPINNSLGFAYIIPYSVKQQDGSYKQMAQFQLGYKAFVQLAMRSGQFKTISATPVYEGQLVSEDPLNGFEFNWKTRTSETVIGFASFFRLLNGFEKTLYMTVDQLKAHGVKYSKTANDSNGRWKTDFEAMALKTVLKLLLSKYAPLSIDMQTAAITDQSVINDINTMDVTYVDNDEVKQVTQEEKENERMSNLIHASDNVVSLKKLLKHVTPELRYLYDSKLNELENNAK